MNLLLFDNRLTVMSPDISVVMKVVFPHSPQGQGLERCARTCTPGSLGTMVRIGADLCRTKEGEHDFCREEVEVDTMASKMCEAWAKIFPEFLHPDGSGKQVQHDPAKVM